MSQADMTTKALQRLVEALTHPETDMNRIEMIEGALAYAALALGEDVDDEESLIRENLEQLAAQTLIDKLDRENLTVYQYAVQGGNEEELGSVMVTTSPTLGALVSEQIKALLETRRAADTFDVC